MLTKTQEEMLQALLESSEVNPIDITEKFNFSGNQQNYADYLGLTQMGYVADNSKGSWLTEVGAGLLANL